MRLINELKLNESKVIDNITYTTKILQQTASNTLTNDIPLNNVGKDIQIYSLP